MIADAEKINRFYAAGYPEGDDWGVSQTAVFNRRKYP